METLIIDMKNDHYTKDTDIKNLLKYIAGKGKRAKKCVCSKGKGLAKEYSKAAEQIITMQKFLGKNKKRRCYHMIISFPGSITDKNAVVIVAEAVAEKIFPPVRLDFCSRTLVLVDKGIVMSFTKTVYR